MALLDNGAQINTITLKYISDHSLQVGPSQSAWCNAVVLLWKKDSSLQFCTDFHHLNTHTEKDSYALPRIQEHWRVW